MTAKHLIYGLFDPQDGQLRYIGQSTKGLKRPIEHWTSKRCLAAKDHCHCWIRQVLALGKIPDVEILEELDETCSRQQLDEAEIFWIGYFKMVGCRLTNLTRGGSGGVATDPDSIRRMSFPGEKNPFFGKTHSLATRKKISQAKRGKPSGRLGTPTPWLWKKVRCTNDGKTFESMKSAAAYYNVHCQCVSDICRGKASHVRGLNFEYAK